MTSVEGQRGEEGASVTCVVVGEGVYVVVGEGVCVVVGEGGLSVYCSRRVEMAGSLQLATRFLALLQPFLA